MTISVIEKTKKYVVLKIPRVLFERRGTNSSELQEAEALKILRAGMREYRQRKTKPLRSLRDLRRHGN